MEPSRHEPCLTSHIMVVGFISHPAAHTHSVPAAFRMVPAAVQDSMQAVASLGLGA